ncbi:sulfurtransferase-like selenium metabolism protein YedF [Desulfohalovibrio reitneri]|uniref:sulfurtransferase-like selenium metabolism protein YedF n=1 Tax=Desulfohalovibrio reitneri TaxID=1307759 RepID=UPI0004A783CE|nr:sulfurtransferase-like selenium metabolism protein YedF [Desulfohalovibrio reitneri]
MPEIVLDCQGLSCPQPVLRCKERLDTDAPMELQVVVDNAAARDNVSRFLASRGYVAEVTENADGSFHITARSGQAAAECEECRVMGDEEITQLDKRVAVFITAETIGRGDDALGARLMANFLATLPEMGGELWRVILVNGAVRLACSGHECLDKLKILADSGVKTLVCGTCLEHFGLLDSKEVGETTNMLDVVTGLQNATSVIKV